MPENSVYPPEIRNINIGDARSNVMFSMKIEKYVTKFTEEKARSEYLTLDKLIRAITLDSTGEIIDDDDECFSVEVEKADLDAFIEKKLGPAHITEFDRLVVNEHNAQLTLGNSFRAATTTCLKVFKKLDERSAVLLELSHSSNPAILLGPTENSMSHSSNVVWGTLKSLVTMPKRSNYFLEGISTRISTCSTRPYVAGHRSYISQRLSLRTPRKKPPHQLFTHRKVIWLRRQQTTRVSSTSQIMTASSIYHWTRGASTPMWVSSPTKLS
jgi:hypothetical protein